MLVPAERWIDILLVGQGKGHIENGLSSSALPQEGRGGPGGDAAPSGPGFPLLLIRTGEFRAGIPVGRVREVVRLRKLSRVPDEKPPFRGLLSLRGEIVTVVDLAGLHAMSRAVARDLSETTGAPARHETTGVTTGAIRPTRIDSVVVLRGGRDPLGLEVDGVEDIRDFASRPEAPESAPSPAPAASESTATQAPAPGRMWAGIVKDERGEVGILDAEFVFEMVESLAKQTEEPQALEVGDIG